MISLQILAAATCPTGQTAAPPNISSSCVWSTERTPSAFDCPGRAACRRAPRTSSPRSTECPITRDGGGREGIGRAKSG